MDGPGGVTIPGHGINSTSTPAPVSHNNGGHPAAPLTLTASTYSASQISLSWVIVPGAGVTYQVEQLIAQQYVKVNANGTTTTIPASWKVLRTQSTDGYIASNLQANQTYEFRIVSPQFGVSNYATATTGIAVDHPEADAAYSNVSGTLFGPSGQPSYLDVKQGNSADCWLLASLAEVADRAPQDIVNMFTPDGTTVENGVTVNLYTVHLFNTAGKAVSVVVDTELPDGGKDYDQPVNNVLWVALAEKAYVRANGKGYVDTSDQLYDTKNDDSYAALDNSDHPKDTKHQGGCAPWALQAITNLPTSSYDIDPTDIATAWSEGKFIVIGTAPGNAKNGPVSPTIEGWHAYAVVNCTTPSAGQDDMFAYANPLATGNPDIAKPTSNMPFIVFNPHGTTAQGWDPDAVGTAYGLFEANENFLSENYANETVAGAVRAVPPKPSNASLADACFGNWAKSGTKTELDLMLAGWGT
jgi:hypothetical protein